MDADLPHPDSRGGQQDFDLDEPARLLTTPAGHHAELVAITSNRNVGPGFVLPGKHSGQRRSRPKVGKHATPTRGLRGLEPRTSSLSGVGLPALDSDLAGVSSGDGPGPRPFTWLIPRCHRCPRTRPDPHDGTTRVLTPTTARCGGQGIHNGTAHSWW